MSDVRVDADESGLVQLYVSGDIDLMNAAEITTTVIEDAPATGEIVLNLTSVTYFDTTGVKMLLNLKQTFEDRLTIVPGIRVLKILGITGLRDTFRLRVGDHTDGAPEIGVGEKIQLPRQDEECVE